MPEVNLLKTFDAQEWAQEFIRLNPACGMPEDVLIGWFANALMKGWDEHRFSTREYKMEVSRALFPWWNWKRYAPYVSGRLIA